MPLLNLGANTYEYTLPSGDKVEIGDGAENMVLGVRK